MTTDAIIGSSGFVGSSLLAQRTFGAQFHSRNIVQAEGRVFNTVVCAGAPGSMFEANRLPDRDDQRIDGLIARLGTIEAKQFILISTIAVLDRFDGGVDESAASFQSELAYGRNRRRLEVFCTERFGRCLIVRLPALFGPGLRKNFVFDVLNPVPSMLTAERLEAVCAALPAALAAELTDLYHRDEQLGMMVLDRGALDRSGARGRMEAAIRACGASASAFTSPSSTFQYYPVPRLWHDIELALSAELSLLHLAPEPVSAAQVYRCLTGDAMTANEARVHHEDMRTRHSRLFGAQPPYMASAAETLKAMELFARAEAAR